VWVARLRFDARVVNRSKNNGYIECDIADPDGKRIAKAMPTCTVLRGEQATWSRSCAADRDAMLSAVNSTVSVTRIERGPK
jgi:hypothetical protein